VLTLRDLIEAMESALARFSTGKIEQPVRTMVTIGSDAFFWTMPALAR
jgi:hypothetical protein